MFATCARTSPWSARVCRFSFSRATRTAPVATSTRTAAGSRTTSSPRGPRTRTSPGADSTLTFSGIATGRRPMRDISPHLAEQLAGHLRVARGPVGEHALRRGEHRHAQPVAHLGDLAHPHGDAPARTAHAPEAVDGAGPVGVVAQLDHQDRPPFL